MCLSVTSLYGDCTAYSSEPLATALQAAGRGQGNIVLLLDLTAAFDRIDHILLLRRLSSHCGFAGKVLAWMASYLEKRTQSVKIGEFTSDSIEL